MKQLNDEHPLEARLGSVLAVLTARFTTSALILITAATEEDDTSRLAESVTRLVLSAGKRAAYVSLAPSTLVFEGSSASPEDVLRLPRGMFSTPAAFDSAAALWRARYDFVFVDAPNLLAMTLAPHVARTADGVLVAVRRGRVPSRFDRDAAAILKHLHAVTLGVVTTSARDGKSARLQTADNAVPRLLESDLTAQPVSN
jgi:hypothetical protein